MRRRIHVICILYMYFPPHKGGYVSVVYLACMPSNSMPSKSHACPQSRMHAFKVAFASVTVRVVYLACSAQLQDRRKTCFFLFFFSPFFIDKRKTTSVACRVACHACRVVYLACMPFRVISARVSTRSRVHASAHAHTRTHTRTHTNARAHTHTHTTGASAELFGILLRDNVNAGAGVRAGKAGI